MTELITIDVTDGAAPADTAASIEGFPYIFTAVMMTVVKKLKNSELTVLAVSAAFTELLLK